MIAMSDHVASPNSSIIKISIYKTAKIVLLGAFYLDDLFQHTFFFYNDTLAF